MIGRREFITLLGSAAATSLESAIHRGGSM